ncbi:hypothetical protein POX_c04631 [Penicillium oxalicum]|uniref:hypothetical protein n=1 Tax=Penicillium oxalicum TaxID=69781 RepID=UPI0020B7D0FB|nr:hypothetical protein POX_c04551 [Penicillium oxalicum]XP_049971050.1 hypothetical protein POX_c04631 [Penicillium oxalicum]KAI2791682.1 hypothetical protein POX_c04551 [Penicillium oxalicum]KAI2791753.1 hypothetical protein POX_c04631 [Penicillium oxalicum]
MPKITSSSRKPIIQAPPGAGKSSFASAKSSVSRATRAARSATATADASSQAKNRVAKLKQYAGPSPKVDWHQVYEKCLVLLQEADEDSERLEEKINEARREATQIQLQLRSEVKKATAEVSQLNSEKQEAMGKIQALEGEVRRLKQDLETTNVRNQDHVAWSEIFPVLQRTHSNLISAADGVWKTYDTLQNKRNGTFLPGSGVSWLDQPMQLAAIGPSSLPDLALAPDNLSVDAPQAPAQLDQYGGHSWKDI